MKPYFGEIIGNGGRTSRSGTLGGGLVVKAHSKQGSVIVQLSECSGVTRAKVWLTKNPLTGKGTESVLYDGPVSGYNEPDVVIRLPSRAVRQVIMPDPEILSAETDPAQLEAERRTAHAFTVEQNAPDWSGSVRESELPTDGQVVGAVLGFFNLPVQRRTQPAFAPADLSMLRSTSTLVGGLDPTGDEMIVEPQDYDCNEGYEAEPRRPRGKLTLLRSVDD